ncbi:LysM peptidoglycan-binding domain-containing protein [Kitasatospora sp. NBC_01287]|nr:LysM peptidoglycan-binding domain-containing protein [Kitasatospora sp. NBC_01287]
MQTPVQVPAAAPAVAGSGHDYTVRAGDTLSTIAQSQHLADGWQGLYQANHRTVGANPDLIVPGQQLNLG